MSWSDTSIPMKFESADELIEKIDKYFLSCVSPVMEYIDNPNGSDEQIRVQKVNGNNDLIWEQIEPYTVSGLAMALGTNRDTLLRYQKLEQTSMDQAELVRCSDAIKQAKHKIENYLEKYMFNGKNQTTAIFMAKNNHGYIDKSEQDLNVGTIDPEKIKEKVGSMFNDKPE